MLITTAVLVASSLVPPPSLFSAIRPRTTTTSSARSNAAAITSLASSFEDLNVRPELCEALAAAGVAKPNALQEGAVPAIIGRENLIIGAQTGAGKTLTYLVPVMQSIKNDEEAGNARARPRRPRAIVLVPTRELALQVHGVAKSLSHYAKLSAGVVHGGVPDAPQLKRLAQAPLDLLVATPGRLLKLMDNGGLFLGDVRHVVLDEVDTMFEAGFGPELDKVLAITTRDLYADGRKSAASQLTAASTAGFVQHLAVGATHPESARSLYMKWLSGARTLMLEGSHSLPPTLRQHFKVCNGPTAKVSALRELLGAADTDGRSVNLGRTVLFCNSQQSARFVDHTLVEDGYATANYHGAVPANERQTNYNAFVSGDKSILVTTDLAARGLDELDVSHVVQFDFAKSAADYVHRCGRTARAGKTGDVTSFVTKSDAELVRTIRDATSRGADVVAAGEAHQRVSSAKAAVELPSTKVIRQRSREGGGGGARKPALAAFPETRGISSNGEGTSASHGKVKLRGQRDRRRDEAGAGSSRRGRAARGKTRRSR